MVADNSPCPHDMLFPACNRGLYERAGYPNHPNCQDNLLKKLRLACIMVPVVPDPVSPFQRSEPQPDGHLEVLASDNPPRGNVPRRADRDLLLVVTGCSVHYHPTIGDRSRASGSKLRRTANDRIRDRRSLLRMP
ncbi:DUF1989 domain-containing protein [Aureimonas pseudogalii]|uniref:DUF1989 domain-containing protein n=1 Tax=Aureimonas pseudogalii TaxID=1744844 RepID=UPI001FE7D635